jgi:hypothetical protein
LLSPKVLTTTCLVLLALFLAVGNVWFAAARSTIPLRLNAVVEQKEIRHEKHPPKDDVCLLDLGRQGMIHVDQEIFDFVNEAENVRKEPWSHFLECNDRRLTLKWSQDTRGIACAMPITLGVMMVLIFSLWRTAGIS